MFATDNYLSIYNKISFDLICFGNLNISRNLVVSCSVLALRSSIDQVSFSTILRLIPNPLTDFDTFLMAKF